MSFVSVQIEQSILSPLLKKPAACRLNSFYDEKRKWCGIRLTKQMPHHIIQSDRYNRTQGRWTLSG